VLDGVSATFRAKESHGKEEGKEWDAIDHPIL
jgi:hypothetical protein